MELRALVGPDAAAEADIDPAPGEIVQDGEVLRQPDGMPPGSDVRHLPDPDAVRPRRQVGPHEDRIRQVAETVRAEVMLPHPHRVVAELLRQGDLLSQVVEQVRRRLGAAAAVVERGEEANPHQNPPGLGTRGPPRLAPGPAQTPGRRPGRGGGALSPGYTRTDATLAPPFGPIKGG